MQILNGIGSIEFVVISSNDFVDQFSKNISFCQMYEFIKGHSEFVCNKGIPQSDCVCEICKNAVYIKKAMVNNYKEVPINPHDLVEFRSWHSSNQSCMEYNCNPCSMPIKLDMEDGDESSL